MLFILNIIEPIKCLFTIILDFKKPALHTLFIYLFIVTIFSFKDLFNV